MIKIKKQKCVNRVNMSYFERCRYLNLNPVLLARHFHYRFEVFFKEIVVNGPLEKVIYILGYSY